MVRGEKDPFKIAHEFTEDSSFGSIFDWPIKLERDGNQLFEGAKSVCNINHHFVNQKYEIKFCRIMVFNNQMNLLL